VWLFCVLLLLTMLGRAAFVFPFSILHNLWAKHEQLSFKEMIVIWCGPLPSPGVGNGPSRLLRQISP
jgi:NhaP-type Na+/H+ or K+/H+ antiporter